MPLPELDTFVEQVLKPCAQRQTLTLTEAEYAELIQLGDRIEQLDADRIEHLAALAKLRNQLPREITRDLGIYPTVCVQRDRTTLNADSDDSRSSRATIDKMLSEVRLERLYCSICNALPI